MLVQDRLAEIADYCKVDADDTQLEGFVLTAAGYLDGAGVSEPQDGTLRAEQYIQCIKYLTLDQYDQRGGMAEGKMEENPTFRKMLNQLKLTEPVSESDTGEEG